MDLSSGSSLDALSSTHLDNPISPAAIASILPLAAPLEVPLSNPVGMGWNSLAVTAAHTEFTGLEAVDEHPMVLPLQAFRGSQAASPLDLTGPLGAVLDNQEDGLIYDHSGELLIVPGDPEDTVALKFEWTNREAGYDNEIGLYLVDEQGQVAGLAPDDRGYAAAAITDATQQVIFASGETVGATEILTFQGGDRLAFYLIQNSSTATWLTQNADNRLDGQPPAFFSPEAANPDDVDHLETQALADGVWQFAWEDLTGGGDRDFNDVVFQVSEVMADVPVLTDGDVALWESNAIMGYLCSKKGSTDPWPASDARHDILRWQFWELAHFGPATSGLVFERVVKPSIGAGNPDPATVERLLGDFARYADVLQAHLEGRSFLVADHMTLADISVATHFTYADAAQLPLGDHPRVKDYVQRLEALPSFQTTRSHP
jgi:glutathione S-transferase